MRSVKEREAGDAFELGARRNSPSRGESPAWLLVGYELKG